MTNPIPNALYIHVPFCVKRCSYCDFNSSVYQTKIADRYIAALEKELESVADYPYKTVYIGGGTPTAFGEKQLGRMLSAVSGLPGARRIEEYTVEVNPGTVNPKKLALLKDGGVNRVSLGVQSFSERGLGLLGRAHSRKDALDAFHTLRQGGFDNLSVDLIFGWPGQTPGEWVEDLAGAVALGPEHISAYCLSVERGTPLARDIRSGRIPAPDEAVQLDMLKKTMSFLTSAGAGYRRYEISNFARRGRRCRHNINYWKNLPYAGIGAGAVSYLDGRRSSNVRDVLRYVTRIEAKAGSVTRSSARTFRERLTPRRRAAETVIMSLRMTSGIGERDFAGRTGFSLLELYGDVIDRLCRLGLLSMRQNRLRLTRKGLFVADSVMMEFL
ncbi:MAG: radical SAM family heme chaperone HemW [Planctomycetes bacterium]|nr:radical SAM family heme chaperone HemW [Planctomycetota bacterium]